MPRPLLVLLVLAGLISGLRLAALLFDRLANRVHPGAPTKLPPPPGLPYSDLHADTLLWNRDIRVRGRRGHVDLPRLREGGVGLQVFCIVTHAPLGLNIKLNRTKSWDMIAM